MELLSLSAWSGPRLIFLIDSFPVESMDKLSLELGRELVRWSAFCLSHLEVFDRLFKALNLVSRAQVPVHCPGSCGWLFGTFLPKEDVLF